MKALSPEELSRLMAEVPESWGRLLVQLVAATGVRISEAIVLRWKHVDLELGQRPPRPVSWSSASGSTATPISSTSQAFRLFPACWARACARGRSRVGQPHVRPAMLPWWSSRVSPLRPRARASSAVEA